MKVGVTLPQFRDDAGPALEAVRHAEASGLDGVFVFDHLWPLGRPDRPALHGPTLLGAIAAETVRISVGTLVARVGLLPDAVLVHTLVSLDRIAGGRLIAGLGIGDRLSRAENAAYGVAFPPVAARRAALARVCRSLRARGVVTWVGGRRAATLAVGRAEADGVNLWQAPADEVAAEAARGGVDVTWGGQLDLSPGAGTDVAEALSDLARTGASWAVVAPVGAAWPDAVDTITAARAYVN